MRVVIDMQGAQSTGSRDRGIGRYTRSVITALLRQADQHEVVLALNGSYADTITALNDHFAAQDLSPQTAIWYPAGYESYLKQTHDPALLAAQLAYEAFLLSLKPDIILMTSLFEGVVDPTVTSIHRYQHHVPVACILYDLIPLTNPSPYLDNPIIKTWYTEKIADLKQADLLLSISTYSRQEAIDELAFDASRVVNISSAVDDDFLPAPGLAAQQTAVLERYGLSAGFVMYTGGADHRKNLQGLVQAFARLPASIGQQTQLAIVCSLPQVLDERIEALVAQLGLARDRVVLTGYVPDVDLKQLYSLCRLFVFPSLQEGFGLPVLEAMRCGAPVIGSNRSSIPEVIGCADALFDPTDVQSMAALMARAMSDETFRASLLERQAAHAKQFCWDETARRALTAMQRFVDQPRSNASPALAPASRPRLAYFSPLPPAKSGIANYSAMLLPALSAHYDIEVIVQEVDSVNDAWITEHLPIRSIEWFAEHFAAFDRVVYQFGNSTHHWHMFQWLANVPGVVVLHDFFLSGVLADHELKNYDHARWARALYDSHGYSAISDRFSSSDLVSTIWRYPANLPVLQQARGVIVHTNHARALAAQWYGTEATEHCHVVPLVRAALNTDAGQFQTECAQTEPLTGREAARRALGFAEDDIVVCSFGAISTTKLNQTIIDAWQASVLQDNQAAHLIFVGDNTNTNGALSQPDTQQSRASQLHMTGWVDPVTYDCYLQAADMAIQLRSHSRGETSAAALDCMHHGIATIVNAHGSLAELNPQAVLMIPDPVTVQALTQAINTLSQDAPLRQRLANHASHIVKQEHNPTACAAAMHDAIESAYADSRCQLPALCQRVAELPLTDTALKSIASGLEKTFPPTPRLKRCLIDVSHLLGTEPVTVISTATRQRLKAEFDHWQALLPEDWRIEFMYTDYVLDVFRYAQRFTSQCLGITDHWAVDDVVEPWPGDMLVSHELCLATLQRNETLWPHWGNAVAKRWLVLEPNSSLADSQSQRRNETESLSASAREFLLTVFNGLVCQTESQRQAVQAALALDSVSVSVSVAKSKDNTEDGTKANTKANTKATNEQPTLTVGKPAFAQP